MNSEMLPQTITKFPEIELEITNPDLVPWGPSFPSPIDSTPDRPDDFIEWEPVPEHPGFDRMTSIIRPVTRDVGFVVVQAATLAGLVVRYSIRGVGAVVLGLAYILQSIFEPTTPSTSVRRDQYTPSRRSTPDVRVSTNVEVQGNGHVHVSTNVTIKN